MTDPADPPARVRRCNADYRWTKPKVLAFLTALSECGRVAEAARAVGMSRQAAYKLRARLDGARFRAAFEGARKKGRRARAAKMAAANRAREAARRSIWDGPGLDALDYLRACNEGRQGDAAEAHGDVPAAQADGRTMQGDVLPAQGDGETRKPTGTSPGQCHSRSMRADHHGPPARLSARYAMSKSASSSPSQ